MFTFRFTEVIQRPERLPEISSQTLQLRFELIPGGAESLLPCPHRWRFTMNRATVFNDVGILQTNLGTESLHLLRRLAGAGNHRDLPLTEDAKGLGRWGPVIAMVHQGSIEVGHHPPDRFGHR